MALCSNCQTKHTLNVPGKCVSCGGITTHFAYALCDACSQKNDECEWCQVPLSAGASSPLVSTAAGTFFVTCRDVDDGKLFKLRIGEEIHIILPEDQYKWTEWDIKSCPRIFRLKSRGNFTPDPGQSQYGTREFVFEVRAQGNDLIELHEVQRTWSWGWGSSTQTSTPVPGGKQWKATYDIK